MEHIPQHILIRGVNWIGDSMMTIPAMRELRRLFPESRMTLLIQKPMDQLFDHFTVVDHVIGFAFRKGLPGWLDRLNLVRRLRKERFDLCLILPNSFDSALVTFLSGIPQRVGFNRDGRGFLLTKKMDRPPKTNTAHQAMDYLTLVSSLGPVQDVPDFRFEAEEGARNWAMTQLEDLRGAVQGPIIGINPGATYGPAKQWFPERFAELATRLCKERQAGIVVVGGPAEKTLGNDLASRIRGDVLVLSGRTTLMQLAAVLSRCDLLVTNDSGPMHVASAMGTPVVAIFGSTVPGATSPLGPHRIVQKECDCSPCLERTCERGDRLCMEMIHVEDVTKAVDQMLVEAESWK